MSEVKIRLPTRSGQPDYAAEYIEAKKITVTFSDGEEMRLDELLNKLKICVDDLLARWDE